jgi:hypothetical protein
MAAGSIHPGAEQQVNSAATSSSRPGTVPDELADRANGWALERVCYLSLAFVCIIEY